MCIERKDTRKPIKMNPRMYRCHQCPSGCILIKNRSRDNNIPVACKDGGLPVFVELNTFPVADYEVWEGKERKVVKRRCTTIQQ